jgi:F-type H+-transporting ATPase subunit delta
MAAGRSSARRYAEAAFEIAERDGTLDDWVADLETALGLVGAGDVARLLTNPAIPTATRSSIAEGVLRGHVSEGARNLILLLVRRGRADLLPSVGREFRRLRDRRAGIVPATVTSAAPLDDAEIAALRERLGPLAGGTIDMTLQVDPSILGGVVVRLGDRMIDGSVRGRLERLRSRLAAGTFQVPLDSH